MPHSHMKILYKSGIYVVNIFNTNEGFKKNTSELISAMSNNSCKP